MECMVRDTRIHYEEAGTGRPLLALHGRPLDHRHMMNELEPLFNNRRGWRRIYPDLPGMGRTRAADSITSQDQVLEVMIEFMDRVAPQQRFAVAGTSYGGYLARGFVYRRASQIDGIMLNVPLVEFDETKCRLPEHRVLKEDADFLAALTPEEAADLPTFVVAQSMDLLRSTREWYAPAGAMADEAFLQRLRQKDAFSFDVDSPRHPFPGPALFLTGRYDNWCGYREAFQLLDNYPRATFAVLDRAGHALVIEQRGLFNALVSEWLDRVEEYTPQI